MCRHIKAGWNIEGKMSKTQMLASVFYQIEIFSNKVNINWIEEQLFHCFTVGAVINTENDFKIIGPTLRVK